MAKTMVQMVRNVALSPILPRLIRTSYVYALKHSWRVLSPKPVVVDVPRVGRMSVDPWDFVASRLFFFGVWEPSISRFMAGSVRPGSVAIDVGANIGYYTLLMSRAAGPSGHVYAVEPSPEICARLNTNLALNDSGNVTVLPFGVSDRAERRSFALSSGNLGASHFGAPAADGLELRRLADLVPPDAIARTSLIKIDVEGMEIAVLRDLATMLDALPRQVTIIAELRIDGEMRAMIETYRAAGFHTLMIENEYRIWRYTSGAVGDPVEVSALPDGQHDLALVRGA